MEIRQLTQHLPLTIVSNNSCPETHEMNKKITVAITNPYNWPWVRRGSERMLNDLAKYLSAQGYGIEIYTMGPETKKWSELGMQYQTIEKKFTNKLRQFGDCHYFAFALQGYLRQTKASIIHCLNYFDAYAAIKARKKYKFAKRYVSQK